jgi:predicted RNA binding protein YcfA (HicA-like mRNA interferase family)
VPGLPVVSGKDLVKVLTNLGYQIMRQKGSHVRMKCKTPSGEHAITIPVHDEIALGTLNDILNKVAVSKGIPKDDIIDMLIRK